jgi:septal ring factor EnvC (AmiA/AmiB activator)
MRHYVAVEMDWMTLAGAVVMVLGGISALCVSVINAYFSAKDRTEARDDRKEILSKADDAASKVEIVANKATVTDAKLDSIKSTTEESAKNVNGNLAKVQDDLKRSMELNEKLHKTIESLLEANRQRSGRVTDTPPAPSEPKGK